MTAANDAVRTLQAQANRFMTAATIESGTTNFPTVTTDGGMGPNTALAVFKVAGFLGGAKSPTVIENVSSAVRSAAQFTIDKMNGDGGPADQTFIMQNIDGLITMATKGADALGLPPAKPMVVTTGPSSAINQALAPLPPPPSGLSASLSNLWFHVKAAPLWQKGLGVVAIGALGIWAFGESKKVNRRAARRG